MTRTLTRISAPGLAACLAVLLFAGCAPMKPPVVQPPVTRAVAVVVRAAGTDAPIAGAAVKLDDTAAPHVGVTNGDGYVQFPAVSGLPQSHLWVTADGYVGYSQSTPLLPGNRDLVVTLTAAEPPPTPIDPLEIRANFCALTDPATGAPIFTSLYPSRDDATRARWRQAAHAAKDTHYAISVRQGYGAIDPDHASYFPDRMPEFVSRIRGLLGDGFVPIVYLHSGDDWPGSDYFGQVLAAIPRDLYPRVLWVPGWEVVPGGWSTWELCQATRAIRDALGGDALAGPFMALHLGDGRLSFSSNPVEADDPFAGDEIASVRSWYGQQYSVLLYQSALIRRDEALDDGVGGSTWERAHEVLTRIRGDRWQNAPDWFAGLPVRWRAIWWEQNEEWFYRGLDTRERMLEISSAASRMGWQGYGAGQVQK